NTVTTAIPRRATILRTLVAFIVDLLSQVLGSTRPGGLRSSGRKPYTREYAQLFHSPNLAYEFSNKRSTNARPPEARPRSTTARPIATRLIGARCTVSAIVSWLPWRDRHGFWFAANRPSPKTSSVTAGAPPASRCPQPANGAGCERGMVCTYCGNDRGDRRKDSFDDISIWRSANFACKWFATSPTHRVLAGGRLLKTSIRPRRSHDDKANCQNRNRNGRAGHRHRRALQRLPPPPLRHPPQR